MRLITNEKTYRTTCPNCGAEIEYNLNDIKHSYNHGSYIICPNANCHNSFTIKNEDDEREQTKEKERQNLAKSDEERIQKEYEQIVEDIQHHVNTYGKRIKINDHYYGFAKDEKEFVNYMSSLFSDLLYL